MQAEGVIKFDLRFTAVRDSGYEPSAELLRWRRALWDAAMIGQDPQRYQGYGFGNVSERLPAAPDSQRAFIISCTQTGGLAELQARHFSLVTASDTRSNRVTASGPCRPSSESLTHAMVYRQSDAIGVVLHVHSPAIWRNAATLGLPVTDAGVEYGTPAMADEVDRLFRDGNVAEQKIFSMGGHEDGIVAFGNDAGEGGRILLDTLARATEISART